jgi:hypothetical protein
MNYEESLKEGRWGRVNMASTEAVGNGEQQGFTTGATRSTAEGKIDYEGHINPEVLAIFGDYMSRHRVQRDGKLRASDNWQKGIPIPNYIKSLIRHTMELWRMYRGYPVVNPDSGEHFTFRDVCCAIMFNIMGLILELNRLQAIGDQTTPFDRILLFPENREQLEGTK